MDLDKSVIQALSHEVDELAREVLGTHSKIAGIDGGNPNAIGMLLSTTRGVDMPADLKDAILKSQKFAVLPAVDGEYWVTFFPHEVEKLELVPMTPEGKND